MRKLLDFIAAKAKRRNAFFKSEEYRFFLENRHYLMKMPRFLHLYDGDEDAFDVMRANIILYSHLNKIVFETEINSLKNYINTNNKNSHANFLKSLHELTSDQPYYQDGQYKIYMPYFTRALNQIYVEEPEKLLSYPYNGLVDNFSETLIDPFDTYGAELYNSPFSRLVRINVSDKETAFFHYDTNTIYFVNEQGRLDASIVLFDRRIRHPNYSHMLERIRPVVDAYFNFDRDALIRSLHQNGFISNHLYQTIRFRDWANK